MFPYLIKIGYTIFLFVELYPISKRNYLFDSALIQQVTYLFIMAVKLTYFNLKGLGEPVRLLLTAAKIEFEDIRLTKAEWIALKPTLKWPHLPMLEMDGKVLFQSRAISRYIAHKAGLAGSSPDDEVLIDMTVDALEDMRYKIIFNYYTPDSPEREKALKVAAAETVPFYFKNFQEQLTENKGYLVGGKLTWADVWFISHADYMNHLLGQDMLADFPELKSYTEKVKKFPGIKEWIASRPEEPKDLRVAYI